MLQVFQYTHGGEKKLLPGYSTRAGATNPKKIHRVPVAGLGQRRGLRCPLLEMGHTVHSPRHSDGPEHELRAPLSPADARPRPTGAAKQGARDRAGAGPKTAACTRLASVSSTG